MAKNIINVTQKAVIDRLNKYGDTYKENKEKADALQEKINKLVAEQDVYKKEISKALDAAYNHSINTYGECDGVVTDKYKFSFNVGESTIVPKDVDAAKLPKEFQRVKTEVDKTAIKTYYANHGKKIPASLQKFNITIEETATIHCEEVNELNGSAELNNILKRK